MRRTVYRRYELDAIPGLFETPLLTLEDDLRLGRQGDVEARDMLIKANLRLVVRATRPYRNRGVSSQDLFSEGVIGLMKAVERYDPRRGLRFNTYAQYWVTQMIRRAAQRQSGIIRTPEHIAAAANVNPTEAGKRQAKLKNPELIRKARAARNVGAFTELSMESLTYGGVDPEPAGRTDLPPGDEVEALLRKLHAHERKVLLLRYGLEDGREWSLREIAERLGFTREWVRRIEMSAMNRLRGVPPGVGKNRPGRLVFRRRMKLDMSRDTLARRSGVSAGHIVEVESEAQPLSVEVAEKLAKVLRVELSFLLPSPQVSN